MSHYKMYIIQPIIYLIAPSSYLSHYLQKIRNTPNGEGGKGLCSFLYTPVMKMSHYKMYMIQSTVYLIAPLVFISLFTKKSQYI